jgi:cation diffusion facilitator family transporter
MIKSFSASPRLIIVEQRDRQSFVSIYLGLTANILLATVKTTVGILGHSPALLADGINSTSDVAYYIVATVFMRLARKPADDEHPYGHRQLESIAALVVGAFVVTTAVAVFWDSVSKVYDLFTGQASYGGAASLALWVALFTVSVKFYLTWYTNRLGRQTGNAMVMALAYDHRNDIFSASAAALGIFLGQRGLPWVDPLAGALVALVILRTGIKILRESTVDLMNTVPTQQLSQQVTVLLAQIAGVRRVEEVHAHRFGPYLLINLTICIDGSLTVTRGDQIASEVEQVLYDNINYLRRVHVHYHPGDPCES